MIKIIIAAVAAPVCALALVVVAGHYKFNIKGEDIYFAPNSVTVQDLSKPWLRNGDRAGDALFFFEDGSVYTNKGTTTLYGDWQLADGRISLQVSGKDAKEEATLDIVSFRRDELIYTDSEGLRHVFAPSNPIPPFSTSGSYSCANGTQTAAILSIAGVEIPPSTIKQLSFNANEKEAYVHLTFESEAIALSLQGVDSISIDADGIPLVSLSGQAITAQTTLSFQARQSVAFDLKRLLKAQCI